MIGLPWIFLGVGVAVLSGYHAYQWKLIQRIPSALTPVNEAISYCSDEVDYPWISFLVPVWNGAKELPDFLAAFRKLRYPKKELILAVGGDDGSLGIAEHYAQEPEVVIIEQLPKEGKQKALERSLPLSRGEIIYLTDVDCRLTDAVICALLKPILEEGTLVATGPSEPLEAQRQMGFVQAQWAVDVAARPQIRGLTRGLLGRNVALRRQVIVATGNFSTPAPSGTDYTLAKEVLKAGFEIWFIPDVPIQTAYPATPQEYLRKQTRWVRNVWTIGKIYGEWSEVRGAQLTVALSWMIVVSLALGFLGIPYGFVVALLMLIHMVLNRARYQKGIEGGIHLGSILQHVMADILVGINVSYHVAKGVRRW